LTSARPVGDNRSPVEAAARRKDAMIYVCNLIDMPGHVASLMPSHLVSLVAPHEQPPTPDGVLAERHLRVEVHDISTPLLGHILPEREHVATLVDFLRGWRHEEAPVVVHCIAGISRSTAAALIGLVIKAGGREREAAMALRRSAPHAQPNRRIVALADDLLGCQGRLIAAREAMGEAELAPFGPLVQLPLLRD
jgi:predicted protein tyrosine phosphatase